MEVFYNSIKCTECKSVLNSPVLLHCGHSICQEHVKPSAQSHHCVSCDTVHLVPSGGFSKNIALEAMIGAKVQKAQFCSDYEQAFAACKNFETLFADLKLIYETPLSFVNKTIGELKMETDILREEFKMKIDDRANAILKELDAYEDECKMSGVNLTSVHMSDYVRRVNGQLDAWKKCLASFDSNKAEWDEIKAGSKTEAATMEAKLESYKQAILLQSFNKHLLKVVEFSKIQLESERE
jgi:hypothetical protein